MAGRGSHYCIDFGPRPSPTAASERACRNRGRACGELPGDGTFPRADLCLLAAPSRGIGGKGGSRCLTFEWAVLLQLSRLSARMGRGIHLVYSHTRDLVYSHIRDP